MRKAPLLSGLLLCAGAVPSWADKPEPIQDATITLRYPSTSGMVEMSKATDFSATGPMDAIPFDEDPNIRVFNSVNRFGRRLLVSGAVGPDESAIAHAFFKPVPDVSPDFFRDLASEDALLEVEVTGIKFDRPVYVSRPTIMLHKLWNADQVDRLEHFYIHLHDHDTATDVFRDFDAFFPNVFSNSPVPNYVLGVATTEGEVEITGEGTDELTFRAAFPYNRLRNFEDVEQDVPDDLPAPFGYLEPFHFHVEYVVSDAPLVDCDGIKNFTANCTGRRNRVKVKLATKRVAVGTLVTVTLDDLMRVVEVEDDRKFKTTLNFGGQEPGQHLVTVGECPALTRTVTCGE